MRENVKVSDLIEALGMNHAAAPLVSLPLPVSVCVTGFQTGSSVCDPAGHPPGFGLTLQ